MIKYSLEQSKGKYGSGLLSNFQVARNHEQLQMYRLYQRKGGSCWRANSGSNQKT